jgi:hypothetical protein
MEATKTLRCEGCGREVRADSTNIQGLYVLAAHLVAVPGLTRGGRPAKAWCTHARRSQKTAEYVAEGTR